MGTHRVTIDLPEDSYNLLRSVVDSGQYASESDAIADLIPSLCFRDIPNETTVAAMKAGDRGEVTKFASIDELMADLHLVQDHETLKNWMREEVLPAIGDYDANPSSACTPEQLRHHLAQASRNWPNGS